MIMIKIQIFEQSIPIDTYKISKNNIQDGINNIDFISTRKRMV